MPGLKLALGLLTGATLQPAVSLACSPPPPGFIAPTPSQAQIDANAVQMFRDADFIAEVVVERAPRFRLRHETRPPPPGRLRVVGAVKGNPPPIIEAPVADPCLLYFQNLDERIVVSGGDDRGPVMVDDVIVRSLRSLNLGDWSSER